MNKLPRIMLVKKLNVENAVRQRALLPMCGVLLGLLGGFSAWSQTPTVTIETFGEVYARPAAVASNQTKILIYRVQAMTPQSPANIYLNGQYHASLLKGGFTEFCMEPGRTALNVVIDDANRQHTGKLESGQNYEMPAGRTLFMRVRETVPGKPQVQYVTTSEAEAEMASARRQIHTVSRAAAVKECAAQAVSASPAPASAPVVAQPEPQKVSMQADTLFEFGKAELRNSGYATLDKWIQQFNEGYTSIERVKVLGYTDAIGPNQLNALLSQRRAEVVRDYLTSHGLKTKAGIDAQGRGPLELAKLGCGIKPTPENKECHAPNRRVVMVITGLRK
jgi:OOP family OmpA-OmpF porin